MSKTAPMIERVAKTIFACEDLDGFSWETTPKGDYRKLARRIIETMHDPTEAMIDTGKHVLMNSTSEDLRAAWRAMIEEALK
jgi:hypothetical protein